jgi:hypothetical protein
MHLRHQSYVPTGLTANTNRSDSYFDGDEFDEFHEVIEQWTSMSVKCQVCGERIEWRGEKVTATKLTKLGYLGKKP